MQKIISQWLLTALIISLGFGQLLRFDIFGLPLYAHDLLVLGYLVLNCNVGKCKLTAGLKIFLYGLALGWLRALTLYPISSLMIPFLYSLRLLSYLALYLIIQKKSHHTSSYALILAGGITLLIGLGQYFFVPDMRVFKYLGWDDHLNRLIMPHYDPTFTAAMLCLFFYYTYQQYRFSAFFYITGILLSYSRSVWITLLLTIFHSTKKLTLFLLSLTILVISASLLPKGFGEGNNLLRTFSITSRFESDYNYIRRYKWDLISGRGLNTLTLDLPRSDYPTHATGPNNSYLYLLLTTGIIGLVGWGIFLHELYQKSKYKSLVTFLVIGSLFNNLMFYPFTLLLVLLVQGTTKVPNAV